MSDHMALRGQQYHERRFIYRGNAVGIGGTDYPTQATACLTTVGGTSVGSVEDVEESLLGFDIARASAKGGFDRNRKAYVTKVVSGMRNLRVGDAFRVESFKTSLVSTHRRGDRRQISITVGTDDQLVFKLFDRCRVTVYFDEKLKGMSTFGEFVRAFKEGDFRKRYQQRFFDPGDCDGIPFFGGDRLPDTRGYLLYTLVDQIELEGNCRGISVISQNCLEVAGFGRIFLAEVYRREQSCRFNLLRFELLGSDGPSENTKDPAFARGFVQPLTAADQDGYGPQEVVAGSVESNGAEIPPVGGGN
jgi:hypothetical protein